MRKLYTSVGLLLFVFFSINAQVWTESDQVVAADRDIDDRFGKAVAISGNYSVIGSPTEDENAQMTATLDKAGSAYVFIQNANTTWQQMQKIVASDRDAQDNFGSQVDIHYDRIIIGAQFADENANGMDFQQDAGAAYIYELDNSGSWIEVAKLVASDRTAGDLFGSDVAIHGDFVLVCAHAEDEDGNGGNTKTGAGSVYVFRRDNAGNWTEVQKIVASDRDVNDRFGQSVAMNDQYAIIGANQEDNDVFGSNTLSSAGAAYIYQLHSIGVWAEVQKIVANDRFTADNFGIDVAVDGSTFLVGAHLEDENVNQGDHFDDAGSAYVFDVNTNGTWMQTQKLVAPDRNVGDQFGTALAISQNKILIGAPRESEDLNNSNSMVFSGSAYLYQKEANGQWVVEEKIVASDRFDGDLFAESVGLEGNTIIAGAQNQNEDSSGGNVMTAAGSAYLFQRCTDTKSNLDEKVCQSYTSPSGHVWTSSGQYLDTIINATGCDSVITIDLVVDQLNSNLYYANGTLNATANGATYQWVNCSLNYAPISGATNQSYTPTSNGNYGVITSLGTCIDTSDCQLVMVANVVSETLPSDISIFPNPTLDGQVMIAIGAEHNLKYLSIHDVNGRLYSKQNITAADNHSFHLPSARQLYFIQIHTKQGQVYWTKILRK